MSAEARNVTPHNTEELAQWCGGLAVDQFDSVDGTKRPGLNVPTMLGVQRAQVGDTIIRSHDGVFEIVKHPPTMKTS